MEFFGKRTIPGLSLESQELLGEITDINENTEDVTLTSADVNAITEANDEVEAVSAAIEDLEQAIDNDIKQIDEFEVVDGEVAETLEGEVTADLAQEHFIKIGYIAKNAGFKQFKSLSYESISQDPRKILVMSREGIKDVLMAMGKQVVEFIKRLILAINQAYTAVLKWTSTSDKAVKALEAEIRKAKDLKIPDATKCETIAKKLSAWSASQGITEINNSNIYKIITGFGSFTANSTRLSDLVSGFKDALSIVEKTTDNEALRAALETSFNKNLGKDVKSLPNLGKNFKLANKDVKNVSNLDNTRNAIYGANVYKDSIELETILPQDNNAEKFVFETLKFVLKDDVKVTAKFEENGFKSAVMDCAMSFSKAVAESDHYFKSATKTCDDLSKSFEDFTKKYKDEDTGTRWSANVMNKYAKNAVAKSVYKSVRARITYVKNALSVLQDLSNEKLVPESK